MNVLNAIMRARSGPPVCSASPSRTTTAISSFAAKVVSQ
jgi:hypothetical protein